MEAFEHQIVLFLENLFDAVGWADVAIAMAIKSACIPSPSEVTMPLLAGCWCRPGDSPYTTPRQRYLNTTT